MSDPQGGKVNDLDLIKKVQSGDKRAFDLLVAKYYSRISRLLCRMVKRPEEAEDLVQESFIKAYRALPNFRHESSFYTWLYRIAINTAKNHFAAIKRQPPSFSELTSNVSEDFSDPIEAFSGAKDVDTPEHLLMTKQMMQTVSSAIDDLPEELRMAISLRELEGLSYEDIAEAMDCPVGTVRSRIFRAREVIAAKIKPMVESAKGRRW